jgi:hypothetical protein
MNALARRSPYRGPSDPPTPRQAEVLSFCISYLEAHQRTPSTRDLAAHFGWRSCFSAWTHIQALATRGYVELGSGRNFRLLYDASGVQLSVSVVQVFKGEVARGDDPTRSLVDWSRPQRGDDDRVVEVDPRAVSTLINCHRRQGGTPAHRLAGYYLAHCGHRALLELERRPPSTPGAASLFEASRQLLAEVLGVGPVGETAPPDRRK